MSKSLPISNQDLLVYLESRVLVWRVFPYLEKCAAWYLDYLGDWNILKPKIKRLDKYCTKIISGPINEGLDTFRLLCKKYHLKGLIIYQEPPKYSMWAQWFLNPERLLLKMKKNLKTSFPHFQELKLYSGDFRKTQGRYLKFNVGTLMGTEKEILYKNFPQK